MLFFILLPVFNDGSKVELLNLEGTIPVNYKGE
jgi:UEV domain.